MDRSRLCAATVSLAPDLRAAIRRARELGLRGIEIDARTELDGARVSATGVRQVRKWLDDEGVVVAALRFTTRGGYAEPERLEERIAGTGRALALARALGADTVTNRIGPVPPSDAPAWAILVEALRDVGAQGERAGATFCAEAGLAAPADLLRLAAALPEGAIGCTLVTGASIVHGHDPAEAAAELTRLVRHVRLTDAVAGSFAGHGRPVPLGRGDVDLAGTLGVLEERDYRGWFGLEAAGTSDGAAEIAGAIARLAALG